MSMGYIVLGNIFLDTQESKSDETEKYGEGKYFLIDAWFPE